MNKKEALANRIKHDSPMEETIREISTLHSQSTSNYQEVLHDKDSKPVCYYLNKYLAKEIRILAAKKEVPISKLVSEALNDLLYKYKDL